MTWTRRILNNSKQAEEQTEKHTGRMGQVGDEDKCVSLVKGNMERRRKSGFPLKQTDTSQDLRRPLHLLETGDWDEEM